MSNIHFATKNGSAPVYVGVKVDEDGDVGLFINDILVGYMSHTTGALHLIAQSPSEQLELESRGFSICNSLLAVHP